MVNSKVLLVTSTGVDGGVKIYKITIPNSNSLSRQEFHFSANDPYTVTEGQDSDTITLKNPTFNFSLTSKFTPGKIVINGVSTNQDSVINYPIMRNTTVTATAVTIDKNNFPLNYYARDCIDNYASVSSLSNDIITELTDITPMPDASYAFYNCSNLESLDDVQETWDMSNVTNISRMFYGCSNLESLDLSNWDLSKVTSAAAFADNCDNLTYVKISNTISNDRLIDMVYGLRNHSSKPFTLDLSNATTSFKYDEFNSFFGLKELDLGPNVSLGTGSSSYILHTFNSCENLERLNLTQVNMNNIKYARCMLRNLTKLKSLDLHHWDSRECVMVCASSDTDAIFAVDSYSGLEVLDLSSFNTLNIRSQNATRSLFYGCNSLEYLIIGNSDFRFRMDFSTNCGQLNTTCKILVPSSLFNYYLNDNGWALRKTQFKPIENYTITRSRGLVSVTPKNLEELDLSEYDISANMLIHNESTIYFSIKKNNQLVSIGPFFFVNLTNNDTSTTNEYLFVEALQDPLHNEFNYKLDLSFAFDISNDNYTVTIPSQEILNSTIGTNSISLSVLPFVFLESPTTYQYPVYGIEFNKSTKTWQRIDINLDPDSNTTTQTIDLESPYNEIESVTIDGCSMVKIPKFYFLYQNQLNTHRWWISKTPFTIEGIGTAKVHSGFIYNGIIKDQFYIGAYLGHNDSNKLGSTSGVAPLTNKTGFEFKAMAEARNINGVSGFSIINIYQLAAIQMLMLINLGTPDVQAAIGTGSISGNNGSTNAVWHGIYELWGRGYQEFLGVSSNYGIYELWQDAGNETYYITNVLGQVGSDSHYIADIDSRLAQKGLFLANSITTTQANSMISDRCDVTYSYEHTDAVFGFQSTSTAAGIFCMAFTNPSTFKNSVNPSRLVKI